MGKELTGLTATMHVELHAASFSSSAHPNKMKFRGVLVRLDEASDKAPGGAEGHRILLPADVAKRRISTLIGMGLNYKPELDGHAQRRKVGVIEDAGITGRDLWVEGTIWKHDFPEAEDDLKQNGLGMSMELGDVKVEDSNSDVWKLTDCCFLGGTILLKSKAAYHKTRAIAAAKQGGAMKKPVQKTLVKKVVPATLDEAKIAKIAASAAATALGEVITGTLKRQTEILAGMKETLDVMAGNGDEEEDEEEVTIDGSVDEVDAEEDTEVAAKKDDKEDDDDEDEDDDDDDVDANSDAGKSGSLNDDATNKGDKTTESEEVGPTKKEPITGAASQKLQRENKNLRQKNASLAASIDTLNKQMKKLQKQVTAAAENTTRRSIPPEITGLLAKANINAAELVAANQKLSTADIDAVIAAAENSFGTKFATEQRIEFKNKLYASGLMEEGHVNRYNN